MVKKKIEKVQNGQYIASGTILILTTLFHVPKGDRYIRLVYDLTSCGLNESMQYTKLCMPSVENVLDTSTHSCWFCDVYTAEMFHNYKLSEKNQTYAGVDDTWTEKGKVLSL